MAEGHLAVKVVKGKHNVADVLTKSVSHPSMSRHVDVLGFRYREKRSEHQKEVLKESSRDPFVDRHAPLPEGAEIEEDFHDENG